MELQLSSGEVITEDTNLAVELRDRLERWMKVSQAPGMQLMCCCIDRVWPRWTLDASPMDWKEFSCPQCWRTHCLPSWGALLNLQAWSRSHQGYAWADWYSPRTADINARVSASLGSKTLCGRSTVGQFHVVSVFTALTTRIMTAY